MDLILRMFFFFLSWPPLPNIGRQRQQFQSYERMTNVTGRDVPRSRNSRESWLCSSPAHSAAAFTSCYVLETLSQSPWKRMKWFLFLLFVRCLWFDSFRRRKRRPSAISSAESSCTCWGGSEDPQPHSWLKHIYSISREAREEKKGNVIPLSLFPIC